MSASTKHRKLAAVTFREIVGYSALTRRTKALMLEILGVALR